MFINKLKWLYNYINIHKNPTPKLSTISKNCLHKFSGETFYKYSQYYFFEMFIYKVISDKLFDDYSQIKKRKKSVVYRHVSPINFLMPFVGYGASPSV